MNIIKTISAVFFLTAGLATTAFAELPLISDAHIVQPPPGAKVAAAYFTIKNPDKEPLIINDASGDIARKVEIHLSFVEDDVAKMQKQESVTVDAGESLEFKHGSFHVMLMGLNENLVAGNSIDIQLNTSKGDIDISVPILSLDQARPMGDMKHDMKHDMKEGMKHDSN